MTTTSWKPSASGASPRSRARWTCPEGSSRQRFGFEALESFLERRAQFRLGQLANRREVLRRDLILQARELLGNLRRQHIQTRGKELSHLDHHAAHADRHGAETGGNLLVTLGTRPAGQSAQPEARQNDLPENKAQQ